MDRKKKAEHTRNRERPCLGIVSAATEPHPGELQPKANGITPGLRATCAECDDVSHLRIDMRQRPGTALPTAALCCGSKRSRVANHCARTKTDAPGEPTVFSCDFLFSNRVAGQGSVRKYDAHQGFQAEMAYFVDC